ncbi:hypothetical protein pb186bvf_018445 [Paramecium bursaria]
MALSIPDYRLHLHATNTSLHVFNFVQQKIGGEVIMDIACQFTKENLKIPVRHTNIANIRCIYELENWLEYYSTKEDKVQGFNCPGCKGFTKFLDFGVDYSLLNVLATIKQFKLEGQIAQKKIGLTIGNQYKYHAYAAPFKDKKKLNIPGTSSMMGINRNNQKCMIYTIQKEQIQLSPTQQVIQDDSSYTIMKMQQYLLQKKYKSGKKQIQQLSQIAKQVSDDYLQNTWLNRLGQKSLKNDIVFAFKKILRGKDYASLLVVYFVHFAIWVDYELLDSQNQNYVQKENAFYLKETNNQFHQIYIVGGKTGPYEQNKQFSRIDVPLDPFVVQKKLKVINLVEIPREGYNFMGGIHNGKIYIFYGQRRYVNAQNCIQDELLNSSWRYSNGKWEDIKKKLLPRYDGSSFIVEQTAFGKIMIFYGGLTRQPDGLAQPNCQQQTKAQIFLFDEEKFLGNQSEEFPGFEVTFIGAEANQFRSLCTPILSVPYYNGVQLLLSGEFLKHQLTGKRQIFDFNYSKGQVKLNVIFSFEPPEYALTPYQNRTSAGVEIFTPIHDSCGAILFGQYYSILQVEDPSNRNRGTTTSLIKINLTNGQVKLVEYEDSKSTQDRAKQYLQTLPAIETQRINIK